MRGPAMGGMGGMMAQVTKMQAKLKKVKAEIEQTEFEGSAGDGAVTVVVTGGYECRRVSINPSVVDPEDVEMLEDLVTLAVNNACKRATDESNRMTREAMQLPPGLSGLI